MPVCLKCKKRFAPDPRYYWRRFCPPETPGAKSKCQNRYTASLAYQAKREKAGKKYSPRKRKKGGTVRKHRADKKAKASPSPRPDKSRRG